MFCWKKNTRTIFTFLEIVIRKFKEKMKALNQSWKEGQSLLRMPGESLPEPWVKACPWPWSPLASLRIRDLPGDSPSFKSSLSDPLLGPSSREFPRMFPHPHEASSLATPKLLVPHDRNGIKVTPQMSVNCER